MMTCGARTEAAARPAPAHGGWGGASKAPVEEQEAAGVRVYLVSTLARRLAPSPSTAICSDILPLRAVVAAASKQGVSAARQ